MLQPKTLLPGLAACLGVGVASWALQQAEQTLFGRPYLEALVLAILLGAAIRLFWSPSARFAPGIAFTGRELLELAIVLLGLSADARAIAVAGPALLAGIVVVVAASLAVSYAVGRAAGLPRTLATLVACGNSICGNSAIVAVAPVVGADADDIAAAISFTAVFGIAVVLGLPLLAHVLPLSDAGYGIVAGLTVYAVPQVLAATIPVSATAATMGTLVKLVRVLLLGPVVMGLGVVSGRSTTAAGDPAPKRQPIPWFILGFFAMGLLRSLGAISPAIIQTGRTASTVLTIGAMAALGLGVDVRATTRTGPRVALAVVASLILLFSASFELARLLPVGAR